MSHQTGHPWDPRSPHPSLLVITRTARPMAGQSDPRTREAEAPTRAVQSHASAMR